MKIEVDVINFKFPNTWEIFCCEFQVLPQKFRSTLVSHKPEILDKVNWVQESLYELKYKLKI